MDKIYVTTEQVKKLSEWIKPNLGIINEWIFPFNEKVKDKTYKLEVKDAKNEK